MMIQWIFIIFIILLTVWFLIYLFFIFNDYKREKEDELNATLEEVRNPDVFQQLVSGNTIERVVISGELNLNILRLRIEEEEKKINQINEELEEARFDQQIDEIKVKSIELKNENDQLNQKLLDLQKEFDDMVHGTVLLNSRFLFGARPRPSNSIIRSRNKELLHYLYKDIKDPFNIIFDKPN